MRPAVLELTISIKYNVDLLNRRDIERISREIDRPVFPVKHTNHSFTWLVVTREPPQELVDRISPTLEAISGTENWWAIPVTRSAGARHGSNDPLVLWLPKAWREADRRANYTKTQDLHSPKSGDIFVKHGIEEFDRKAAVKMGLRGSRKGQPPPNADQPEGEGTQDTNSLRAQAEALFSPKPVTQDLTDDAE